MSTVAEQIISIATLNSVHESTEYNAILPSPFPGGLYKTRLSFRDDFIFKTPCNTLSQKKPANLGGVIKPREI